MDFETIIQMLSKGSAQAVTTMSDASEEAKELKAFLYVKTNIERDLRAKLADSIDEKKIIFLCGSSGDGKSEIFRRTIDDYNDEFEFHLDATHSFHPDKTAIETLDDRFRRFEKGSKSLVVGINIGMLGNYAAEGCDDHEEIRDTINTYLEDAKHDENLCAFVCFEDYPKFELDDTRVSAPFIGRLDDQVLAEPKQIPASEDACYMIRAVQERGGTAAHIVLGCPVRGGHHNSLFDIDEDVMGWGVDLMDAIVLRN